MVTKPKTQRKVSPSRPIEPPPRGAPDLARLSHAELQAWRELVPALLPELPSALQVAVLDRDLESAALVRAIHDWRTQR